MAKGDNGHVAGRGSAEGTEAFCGVLRSCRKVQHQLVKSMDNDSTFRQHFQAIMVTIRIDFDTFDLFHDVQ